MDSGEGPPPWKSDMADIWDYPFCRNSLIGSSRGFKNFYSSSNDNNWVDIFTSFIMEATLFVKTDVIKGIPMDPDGYVKVRSAAIGFPNQSQVIKRESNHRRVGLIYDERMCKHFTLDDEPHRENPTTLGHLV